MISKNEFDFFVSRTNQRLMELEKLIKVLDRDVKLLKIQRGGV